MAIQLSPSVTPVPKLSGVRDDLTLEERERSLDEAIQWLRDELNSLKSQDQSLMRKFLALRSEINTLKDDMPTSSTTEHSHAHKFQSPKPLDDDVFFADNPQGRVYSDMSSAQRKSYSSGSDEEKL